MSTKTRKESPALAVTNQPGSIKNKRHANPTTLSPVCKCPLCGHEPPSKTYDWLIDLEALVTKYSHLGINADLAALTLWEAWGLYLYLRELGG